MHATKHAPCRNRRLQRRRAFTLIELLVSIAIIFLLITAAAVALKTARRGASRTESVSALRQMMAAYNNYASEHKGRLLPGYINPDDFATAGGPLDIKAKLASGVELVPEDAASYVWRLAPYLSYDWKILMTDYHSASVLSVMEQEFADGVYGPGTAGADDLGIARVPSFGLNSVFLGGDSYHGGNSLTEYAPWGGTPIDPDCPSHPHAASRIAQVKNPSSIVVFAPCQATAGVLGDLPAFAHDKELRIGYPELRPPYGNICFASGTYSLDEQQWALNTNNQAEESAGADFSAGGGLPVDRFGEGRVPVAHLDGSVEIELIGRLATDPSRWSPFALDNAFSPQN